MDERRNQTNNGISARKQIYCSQHLWQKTRKVSDKQANIQLKELEKEQQNNPKIRRKKEIVQVRQEIKQIESKRTIHKISESKSQFLEKKNKHLTDPTDKNKWEKARINNIKYEKGNITADMAAMQRIIRNYLKQLYAHKSEDLH